MQTVSQNWKNNQLLPLVNKGYLKLDFSVANTDLYAVGTTATATNYTASVTNPSNVIQEERVTKPQSVLGLNQFVLDGNTDITNQDTAGVYGQYFSRPNNGTQYQNEVVTTINFASATSQKTKSIMLVFDENRGYAIHFKLEFNTSPATTITITNNDSSVVTVPLNDLEGFSRIKITLYKWSLPYQKMCLNYVFLGFTTSFSDKDIFNYQAKTNVELTNKDMPQNDVTFEIDNTTGVFDSDPNNTSDNNLYKYLATRQKVVISYGYKFGGAIEWIKGGTFYLSEWNCPQNGLTATFTAKNILSFLSQPYSKNNNDSVTYEALANDVLSYAGVSSSKRYLQSNKLSGTTNASLNEVTCAEVLQYIAQANGCVLSCDRDGVVRIAEIPNVVYNDYPVDLSRCYSYPEIVLEEETKNLTVNYYTYSQTSSGGDVIEVITKNATVYSNNGTGNELTIDNPIIHTTFDYSNYLSILNKRVNYECELRIDPRLELFDIVPLTNKNGNTQNVIITNTTIDYNGGFSGKARAKVWQ